MAEGSRGRPLTVDRRKENERNYREIRRNVEYKVENLPYVYRKLPLAAQARLNRLVIAHGLMFVYWDSIAKQRELAEAFEPLKVAKHTQFSYEPSTRGRTLRSIHEKLDERGVPHYPEQTSDERYAGSVLRVLITATLKLKGSDNFRILPRGERLDLHKLHGLSRKATDFEANPGQRS